VGRRNFTPSQLTPKTAKILFGWSWRRGLIPPPFIVVLSEAEDLPILGRGKRPLPNRPYFGRPEHIEGSPPYIPKRTFLLCYSEGFSPRNPHRLFLGRSWRRAMPSSINGDPSSLALLGMTRKWSSYIIYQVVI